MTDFMPAIELRNQAYEHARHVQNQRTTFMNYYILLATGFIWLSLSFVTPHPKFVICLAILFDIALVFFVLRDIRWESYIKHDITTVRRASTWLYNSSNDNGIRAVLEGEKEMKYFKMDGTRDIIRDFNEMVEPYGAAVLIITGPIVSFTILYPCITFISQLIVERDMSIFYKLVFDGGAHLLLFILYYQLWTRRSTTYANTIHNECCKEPNRPANVNV